MKEGSQLVLWPIVSWIGAWGGQPPAQATIPGAKQDSLIMVRTSWPSLRSGNDSAPWGVTSQANQSECRWPIEAPPHPWQKAGSNVPSAHLRVLACPPLIPTPLARLPTPALLPPSGFPWVAFSLAWWFYRKEFKALGY